MKTTRQIVLLMLGIAAGVGAYSLFKYVPVISTAVTNSTVGDVQAASVSPQLAEVAAPHAGAGPVAHHHRHGHRGHHAHRTHQPPQAAPSVAAAPAPVVAVAPVAPPAPTPTFFKADGYVEKADGQLEAIIIQNDGVEIFKLGDKIGEHLRVTSISRDSVGAIDEASFQMPLNQQDRAEKLQTGHRWNAVMASMTSSHGI